MMSISKIIAVLLIVFGVVGLAYGGFTYTSQEKVAQIGDLKITAATEKSVPLPPILGGLCLAVGIVLLITSKKQ